MHVRLRELDDKIRRSLFFVPMLFVVAAVVLGELMLVVDERVDNVPSRLTATVESARGVLTVVASATLAFAGIAFSVSLLLLSLASSQFSPRVVHGLFRDPYNKRIMGIVIGTFTYSLVVLRAVRGPLEEAGNPVVPSISILVAVLLGVVSVLSIVAFISHSAHTMDVSVILHRVSAESIAQARSRGSEPPPDSADGTVPAPSGPCFAVPFAHEGWVQQIHHQALLEALEPGASMRLDTTAGHYAIPRTPLCVIWPRPTDEAAAERAVRRAVIVGQTRTMQQDTTYGARQLADVALKALSPGINDPTTAQDALFHLGAVVSELLVAPPAPRVMSGKDGRVLVLAEAMTPDDVIGLAFDEVRIAAADQPTVQIYLLEILRLLDESLGEGYDAARRAIRTRADLIVEISDAGAQLPHDKERVRSAHRHRFGAVQID